MTTYASLPRGIPEAHGIPSATISAFIDAIEAQHIELHSLMLVRHGQVIAEGWWSPYSADQIHLLYSLSKSFTATAIGIAVNEGRLSTDDLVCSFFPDKLPDSVSEHLAKMKVHHLLSMSTGHLEDALNRTMKQGQGDWVSGFLAVPPDQAPGSIFTYNNAATFMLSAILQKLTNMKLVDYLQPRLFEPLGITETYWYENPQGINQGFSGLHITTEAIAKLGQLYLQQGVWQGQQLVPRQWVEAATTKHIATNPPPEDETPDWAQGYGYQFWQCRHHTYRADGAFGQFCLVMPTQETVLAVTAGVEKMQPILSLVWEHLLPAMADQALSDDSAAQSQLANQLKALSIEPTQAEPTSPLVATISGKTYDFVVEENRENEERGTLSLNFQDKHFTFVMIDDDGEATVRGGYNAWVASRTTFYDTEEVPVMVSGTWLKPNHFRLEIRYIQTPHALMLNFHFDEESLQVTQHWNVMFDSTEMSPVEGTLRQ